MKKIALVVGVAAIATSATLSASAAVTSRSNANVPEGADVEVPLAETAFKPGLNELTWRYDTTASGNWLVFDYHQLTLDLPPNGTMMIVR